MRPLCSDGTPWHAWGPARRESAGTTVECCMTCGARRITVTEGETERVRYARPPRQWMFADPAWGRREREA